MTEPSLASHLTVAALALFIERFSGYPAFLQRVIGHPVQWMGAAIALCERRCNRPRYSPARRRFSGALALALPATFFVGVAWLLARFLPFWAEALLATSLLAQKSLTEHVRAIVAALENAADLRPARRALSMIVGRDTADFDESAIAHAAIESLAENASDGIIAPLFWLAALGLPGITLYKLVNTADSMIGHLNDRYRHFGWAAARLDDVLNFIPARITALLYALAAVIVRGARAGGRSLKTFRRDARKHVSPNAGWPEAAMAGALGIRLGGPRSYAGRLVAFPWLGEGRAGLSRRDIERALDLHECMLWVATACVLAAALAAI